MKNLREKYRKKNPIVKKIQVKRILKRKLGLNGIKKKKNYIKVKCAYVDKGGKLCKNFAVGKGQLCKKHGGKNDITNTLSPEATQLMMATSNTKMEYLPTLHPIQFIDLSRQGMSEVEIAAELMVGVTTLRKWSETYEAFGLAYEIGQALHETWWLQKGKAGLDERYFNTHLFKFLTGNKLGYAEKVENKNLNMNVHGVLVVPEKQSIDEWEASGVDDIIDVESETK